MAIKLQFLKRLLVLREDDKADRHTVPSEPVSGSKEGKNASKDLVTGR